MALQPDSIRADAQTMETLGRIAEAMDRSRNWVINDVADHERLEEQVGKSRQEIAEGKGIPHDEAMAKMRQHIETHTPSPL